MAEAKKQEVASQGKQQASLVVNNAFVDGLVVQLQQKEKFGLTFPKGYNYANELMFFSSAILVIMSFLILGLQKIK